jgi:hypothetical protein
MWLDGPDVVPDPFTLTDGREYINRALDSTKGLQSGASWAGPGKPTMYSLLKPTEKARA